MGVVNRTPDSFFDGGHFLGDASARSHVERLLRDGADVLDIGAESTRPGAPAIAPREQMERLGDAIAYAVSLGATVSVDTTSPEVARFALEQGARMINSVALEPARDLAELAVAFDADLVLTHCRGSMTRMPGFSTYDSAAYGDVVRDVANEWSAAAGAALAVGLAAPRLWFDPGLGFTKNAEQSLELCVRLRELKSALGHPFLVGASRKSYLGAVTARGGVPAPASERLGASLAAALDCASKGADMLRVHDVAETVQALAYQRAVQGRAEQLDHPARDVLIHEERRGGMECSRG
jgi:dihydropteroate synthase